MSKQPKLISNNEFSTTRCYLRRVPDRNPFVSATILLILEQCKAVPEAFAPQLAAVREQIKSYQVDHLTYHWPLVHGESRIANAPLLGALPQLALSPDADCSVLQVMALNQPELVDALCDELAFYRVDNERFQLAKFQHCLGRFEQTFLTWFPPKQLSKNKKIETIDLAVNANILWFLGRFKRLDIRGVKESIEQMRELLQSNIILEKPFSVSMYYPKAILILYMIARAIDWGSLTDLDDMKTEIVRLLQGVQAETSLDSILLAATYTHCGEQDLASKHYNEFKHYSTLSGGYYVLPIYSALALRFPIFYKFASWSATHIQFESDALQISLAQWVIEKNEFSS